MPPACPVPADSTPKFTVVACGREAGGGSMIHVPGFGDRVPGRRVRAREGRGFQMHTLIINELGFNQNYHMFALV